MRLLRSAIFSFLAAALSAQAEVPECQGWGGVLESQSLYFVGPERLLSQRALLDFEGRFGPSWLQAHLEGNNLRIENVMPGVGIPATIYHFQVAWLNSTGELLSEKSFPEKSRCEALSLFPGQSTASYVLKAPDSQETLRLQIRVWAVVP